MSYNHENLPHFARTAGKITVITALAGLLVFMIAFIFDVGTQELNRVSAQSASTTLTVLNTPPAFTLNPYEVTESSTSTPTNSGDNVTWSAIGDDANGADYYLLICSTNASPTPNASAAPDCGGGTQWAVSTSTTSGSLATTATTTTEAAPFLEANIWFAWVCDGDASDPRCIIIPEQGDYATSSSAFHVNKRPAITDFDNDGPADPSADITFYSTSTDPDTVGGSDALFLVVCGTNTDYNVNTNTCDANFIASTTITVLSDASATYTVGSIVRDDTYGAYGYIVDEHGHEATANPFNADFVVNNVAPTVLGGDVLMAGYLGAGTDLKVDVLNGQTPSSTIDFKIRDANSCLTAASTTDEIAGYTVAVYRSSYTCDGETGPYDPNNCYTSASSTATWDLSCMATSTCASPNQDYMDYTCTFPLWFLADPTDNAAIIPAAFEADIWTVAVAGVDDNYATGTSATNTSQTVELESFNGITIGADDIAYGGVEPGDDTGTLSATSTLLNVGNTGLDQEAQGESMCGTFSLATKCAVSATSTIPAFEQKFSSTSLSYASGLAEILASTTATHVELNVKKSTTTGNPTTATTYWGIAVPATITLAGSYTGLNTLTAVTAEVEDW